MAAIIRHRSQIPLADRRRNLACDRGFHGRADRIQNHLFSLTDESLGAGACMPASIRLTVFGAVEPGPPGATVGWSRFGH